jgi:hypothetical protein
MLAAACDQILLDGADWWLHVDVMVRASVLSVLRKVAPYLQDRHLTLIIA